MSVTVTLIFASIYWLGLRNGKSKILNDLSFRPTAKQIRELIDNWFLLGADDAVEYALSSARSKHQTIVIVRTAH